MGFLLSHFGSVVCKHETMNVKTQYIYVKIKGMEIQPFGKLLIAFGVFLVVVGVLVVLAPKVPYIGRLPGDIYIQRDNFTFYFPIVSSVLISVILTLILNLIFGKR